MGVINAIKKLVTVPIFLNGKMISDLSLSLHLFIGKM